MDPHRLQDAEKLLEKTDIKLSVKQTFGFESDMQVGAFSKKNEYVPKIDADYKFDKDTTLAILAGFSFNKRVKHTFFSFSYNYTECKIQYKLIHFR